MDDVIARVRAYGENLTRNGAPHQTGIGSDILKVVDLIDVTSAAEKLNRDAAVGEIADMERENKRLAQAVAEAAAENAQLRAALDAATMNAGKGAEQSKDPPSASDASQKQTRKKA